MSFITARSSIISFQSLLFVTAESCFCSRPYQFFTALVELLYITTPRSTVLRGFVLTLLSECVAIHPNTTERTQHDLLDVCCGVLRCR
jgi:hypothetical protein